MIIHLIVYIDEQRTQEIYEKYFARVDKKMSMNRKMMKIERNYFARADIVAKTFLFYAIIDCDMKISQLYNELKPRWE